MPSLKEGTMGKARFYFVCILLSVVCVLSFFPIRKIVQEFMSPTRETIVSSTSIISVISPLQYQFLDSEFGEQPEGYLKIDEDRWQTYPDHAVHFGYQRGHLVLKIGLKNSSDLPAAVMLELGWPYLNNIQLHTVSADQQSFDSSILHYFNGEQQTVHRHPLYKLEFGAGEIRQIYLALETSVKFIVPIKIWDLESFEHHRYHLGFWYGSFFAVMAVMLFYNFILGSYTRDDSYLFYCLYVISVIFYVAAFSGFGAQYLWRGNVWLYEHSFGLSSSFSFLCVVLFMRRILELDRYGGGVLLLNRALGWVWFVIVLGHFITFNPLWLFLEDITAIISCPAGLGSTIYLWRKGNVSAKYLTIAWTVLIIATLLLMLGLTGLISYTPQFLYVQMVGFVIEVILLSLALAERINRERSEKEAARKEALAYSQRIGEAQHREMRIQRKMLELKEQLNKDLEERVESRTQELHHALDELEKVNRELEKLSITDPLTQIANRRYYEDILAKELRRALRADSDLTLLVIDIDYFKLVNDTFGHRAGDCCLVRVAQTIQDQLTRASDFVARYGGEEFVIILPDTDKKHAELVAEKILEACKDLEIIWYTDTIHFTVSVGGSWLPKGIYCTGDELFALADAQLYRAKSEGRNKSCFTQFEE